MQSSYIDLPILTVHQWQTNAMLASKISFADLWQIHRLTWREPASHDPLAPSAAASLRGHEEETQRHLNAERLRKIRRHVQKTFEARETGDRAWGLFPTSLILALREMTGYERESLDDGVLSGLYAADLEECLMGPDGDHLYVPRNAKLCLIVDGQHRFYGVKQFRDELSSKQDLAAVDGLEFPATILLDYDTYQIGEVFAKVNFEQKPVNRSLFYDILGTLPDFEYSDIRLAHNLVLHLNNASNSPLRGMVKLLGTGRGMFSQASFADHVEAGLRHGGVWYRVARDFANQGRRWEELAKYLRAFFTAVSSAYPTCWPVEKDDKKTGEKYFSAYGQPHVTLKTTGLGALMRLSKDIYSRVDSSKPERDLEKDIASYLGKLDDKRAAKLFSSSGDYGKAGGSALQQKLYLKLSEALDLK